MPDLSTVLIFVTGILAGAIAALKVVAPQTATPIDDEVLGVLEKAAAAITSFFKPKS